MAQKETFNLSGRGILSGFTSGGGSAAAARKLEEPELPTATEGEEGGAQWIAVDSITPGAFQPRQFFSEESIKSLAQSFKEQGFRGAINVRQKKEEEGYELIAGERRWRAAKLAGLEKIRCIVDEYSDNEALEFALVENLQREDLSKLEETEGILQLIETKLGITRDAAITTIRTEGHSDKRGRSNVAPSEELQKIMELLSFFGIELQTFRTKNLRTLTLPDDLKEAHLTKGLSYNSAIELSKVKDEGARKALLQETLKNKLSFRELKERVKEPTRTNPTEEKPLEPTLVERIETVAKRVKKAKPLFEKTQKRKRLERLLGELEALLDEVGE